MVTNSVVHPFQSAGLGLAPFRYMGCQIKQGPIRMLDKSGIEIEIGSPGQPMGTCDLCGMGIKYCHVIKSADNKSFIVGSDCVEKLGGNNDLLPCILRETKIARRNERMRVVEQRRAERREAAKLEREASKAALLAQHPNLAAALAIEGNDFVDQMRAKLDSMGTLTDRQVSAVLDLHRVRSAPKGVAPHGRVEVRCRLVNVKQVETQVWGQPGVRLLATLEGEREGGLWRAWGTLPKAIPSDYRGEVIIKATFDRKYNAENEAWFARPNGRVAE
jgi:hypothetical protein